MTTWAPDFDRGSWTRVWRVVLTLSGLALGIISCRAREKSDRGAGQAAAGAGAESAPAEPSVAPVQLLYLPDASLEAPEPAPRTEVPLVASGRCQPDMVEVEGRFCIDRFESVLVDKGSGRRLSPYYHPTREQTRASFTHWQEQRKRVGPGWAHERSLPMPPEWQLTYDFEPQAVSIAGAVPNGYLSGELAAIACANAGKRLCSWEEWVTACRGEQRRKFPYGEQYREGECNVFRATHPAKVLHSNPSIGHLDPRLNQVEEAGQPLLRVTGGTRSCRSEWQGDAAYDLVGNLDEWVDDSKGRFAGGFYARSTKDGCDASVSAHPPNYFDYSLGMRCCR